MNFLEQAKNAFYNTNGNLNSSTMREGTVKKNHPNLFNEILQKTTFYKDDEIKFNRRIMLFLDGITERIKCKHCNSDIDPNSNPPGRKSFFKSYCDSSCSGKSRIGSRWEYDSNHLEEINSKRKLTMLERYGVEYNSQKDDFKDFIKSKIKEVHSIDECVSGKDSLDEFMKTLPLRDDILINYCEFPEYLAGDSIERMRVRDVKRSFSGKVIQFKPEQWLLTPNMVKSIIKNVHGLSERIHGRKCVIKEIDLEVAQRFLNENHISGYVGCKFRYGAFYNNKLVHVMTFGGSRLGSEYEYEITRSASLCGYVVNGIVSKLISKFKSDVMCVGEHLITYADLMLSDGKSYMKSGMNLINTTSPSKWYVKTGTVTLYSWYQFQKHKLKDFEHYSDDKTEWEIMRDSGYDRFWDAGNNVYLMQK